MRDIHVPGLIPVGDTEYNFDTDFHVKESRFNFDLASNKYKWPLHIYLELDFLLSNAGNERVSNSFNPRLRHIYFETDLFLAGQTWSTFMIVILPEDLDFIGAPEGIAFIRQPQVRFKLKTWQFAFENPETTIIKPDESISVVTDSDVIPDFAVKKNFNLERGTFEIATLFRQLHYVDSLRTKQKVFGFGITTGGEFKIGKQDDIRFVATYGNGLGRYVALNFVTGAVVDEYNKLKPIETINGYLAYLHYWSDKWKSSINISAFQALRNNNLVGNKANKLAWSASGNILYSPIPGLIMGIEFIHGYRELEGEVNGSFERLQISARYKFGWSTGS
jgi:hypothetical protein